MSLLPSCAPSVTWSWRWAGPVAMLAIIILIIATDIGLYVGVKYGGEATEWGIVIAFPYHQPASFVIDTGSQNFTISWPFHWSILSWILLICYGCDAVLMFLHFLKWKNVCYAVFLAVFSLILAVMNIVTRALIGAALLDLFGELPCDGCVLGNALPRPLIG